MKNIVVDGVPVDDVVVVDDVGSPIPSPLIS